MNKKIICSECGARLFLEKSKNTCNFCGSVLDLNNAVEVVLESDVQSAARDAVSFKKALVVTVNGQQATITDIWDSLTSNANLPKDKLFNFYKNLKSKIRFCIDAYLNMSDDVKYELGDFICSKMEEIINFRLRNNINYEEEFDEIKALISKQRYELKARGIFQIKAKLIIWKRIKRIKARDTVLYYDYALQSIKTITADYNSKIEPIKAEYNATAKTAFSRRKSLKERMDSLELAMKREIDGYGMKQATKNYNRVVRKFKIDHTPVVEEIKEYVPVQRSGQAAVEEVKIDYSAMSTVELIDALNLSLEKLNKGVTRSELDTCKTIKEALVSRSGDLSSEAQLYFNAVMSSVNMVFANDQPTVMEAMLKNLIGNISMQSVNLKNSLNK